ncbi:MAG: hypothetical protein U5N85_02085 [Arcicella sp.]|nr:hypothetical protein [Arcicella sp.]
MTQTTYQKNQQNIISLLQKGESNSYRPEDIKRWGVERFMDTVCEKEDIVIPSLGFTDEENKRMDEILKHQ